MDPVEAKRTLVKSPPEVWAQVSDVSVLAQQLGQFGEIKITRADPESMVEWEGEHATGTVRIEPSGWGTRVTLTAVLPERLEPAPLIVDPAPDLGTVEAPVAVAVAPPEPVVRDAAAEPEPTAAGQELAEPVAVDPPAEPESEIDRGGSYTHEVHEPPKSSETPALEPRPGFFARLFKSRRREPEAVAPVVEPIAEEPVVEPEAVAPVLEPVVEEPVVVTPEPETRAPEPAPAPLVFAPLPPKISIDPVPRDRPRMLTPDAALTVLTGTLDHLGSAHHRPFSRG